MRLHLIRHGETRHNVDNRIQGDLLDDDLNDTGHAQAEALWKHYAHERILGLAVSAVYTSPLKRAVTTARRVAAALELPDPQFLLGVREVSWGDQMGQLNVGETLADMTRVLTAWDEGDLDACVAGGETPARAWARAIRELAPIIEKHARDDIVLVAHGRINKIILSGLLHDGLGHMETYPQANASITIIEGPRPWRLVSRNSTVHLRGLRALDERLS